MSTRSKQIIAIILLLALGLWLVFTFGPFGDEVPPRRKPHNTNKTPVIEPRFQKEGHLAILDTSASDTLVLLDIEIAEAPDEIQYGMMYRRKINPKTGMLFLMGRERPLSFYMKNTYVPLDIIYINDEQKIVSIAKNATPLDETSLPSKKPASLVLEVKGGFSDSLSLREGQKIIWERL